MPESHKSGELFRVDTVRVAVIVVDHGSRFDEANVMLEEVCRAYQQVTGMAIVVPAHMELAAPDIAQAFAECVRQGATEIVILPYFLSPGRHSTHDIPRVAAAAAVNYPGVQYSVAEPLGLDSRMVQIMHRRVLEALQRAASH